jgi:hypothetical protein
MQEGNKTSLHSIIHGNDESNPTMDLHVDGGHAQGIHLRNTKLSKCNSPTQVNYV